MKLDRTQQIMDQIRRVKKAARDTEIAMYGKPLNHAHVVKSKKVYTRKLKHKKLCLKSI